jgi:hypothetical protein
MSERNGWQPREGTYALVEGRLPVKVVEVREGPQLARCRVDNWTAVWLPFAILSSEDATPPHPPAGAREREL